MDSNRILKKTKYLFVLAFMISASTALGIEIGEPAPALKGTLFSGKHFDLSEQKGKVVMINFYSSFCKFCAYEIGNIETYVEANQSRGLVFLAIGVDDEKDTERVRGILQTYNLDGLMAMDLEENGFNNSYPTPTTFLVDRSGTLVFRSKGAKMPSWFRNYVDPLLK
ncbi:MAG: TlpA disulfide reductase family protein [Betaproteobacteria bacterium]